MSDPNGAEAGLKFLAENKGKDGIITLDSGLQYKVLKEGRGMECPKVGTPCSCHYAGRLLDGTEFDSSYKRGEPTQFAPNQVIKGWTESMQLMVEGDKWEMYIPMELAYGPSGKPPKIPAAATLIFVMEIVKIKGASVPKQIDFPEWTEEQQKLWEEKDEAAIQKWRDSKEESYKDEESKLRKDYPKREDFDAWLGKQSKTAKDKSLWKRTRRNYEEEAKPKFDKVMARALLTKAMATFREKANREKLEGLVKECEEEAGDPAQAGMMKMMKLMPVVQGMLGEILPEYGFQAGDLMNVVMQVQGFGAEDPSIAADIGKVMKAVQGDVKDLFDESQID